MVYHNQSANEVAEKYGLPNSYMLVNWVTNYKKKLGKGALTLASMEKSKAKDSEELKKRIKQLKTALGQANMLIYDLNSMIDHAEKQVKLPIRKKRGTNSNAD